MERIRSNNLERMTLRAVPRNSPERFFRKGRLVTMPAKRKNVLLVLSVIVGALERDRAYAEEEVTTIVLRFHDDHCSRRRVPVNERFLRREATGSRYWRADR